MRRFAYVVATEHDKTLARAADISANFAVGHGTICDWLHWQGFPACEKRNSQNIVESELANWVSPEKQETVEEEMGRAK